MKIIIDIPEELYKEHQFVYLPRGCGKTITYNLLKAIKEGTPLEVQRPSGIWIHPYKSDIACECSECHIQMPITSYYHFCPNCGVEMNGGEEDAYQKRH